uniref:BCL2/adenovirus E1B 19 kDa protein-interacting protein 3 n=1 Tax=Strigamia maritima TaxID=126957 RepID=T1IIV1_STRMM
SWVDLDLHRSELPSPLGLINDAEIQRLLLEAQRESNQSSIVVSSSSSRRESPQSPPNSPNAELSTGDDIKDFYINKEKNTDWVWDWSSRPDQQPPKEWRFKHPKGGRLSVRHSKAMKSGLLSSEVLSFVLLTNLVSLLLGAGIG